MNRDFISIFSTVIATTLTLGISSAAKATNLNITIGTNFTGTTEQFFIPPDTMGGVGPNHIIELNNDQYRVYNKTGSLQFNQRLDQFWANTAGVNTSNTFDPRIVYDPSSQRWFASAGGEGNLTVGNSFLLAVSNSSDPTAGWKGFSLPANSLGGTTQGFVDFPTLGLDADGVYLFANMFNSAGNFAAINGVSVPKADLLSPTPTVANATFFQNLTLAAVGFALQPAIDFGTSDGRAAVLAVDATQFSFLDRTNILNSGTNTASLSGTTYLSTPLPTSNPPTARQPGSATNINTSDLRFGGAVFEQGNSLWAVHTIDVGGRANLRWYEINEATNAILQTGTITDGDRDLYFPSIAANVLGEIVIGFSCSSPTLFASSCAVVGQTVGGVTTFDNPLILQQGLATYVGLDSSGRNRWGDYSATVLDPADPTGRTFWTFQEFASATNKWSTQVSQIRLSSPVIIAVPEGSNLLGLGLLGLIGLKGKNKIDN